MSAQIFQVALGISPPWYVTDVVFDEAGKTSNINIDFERGSRFRVPDLDGDHRVHDTVTKRYCHLNFFQHECFLDVRVPRVKLPDGRVRQVQPDWAGKLSGFTLLFEALVLLLAQQMRFRGVARVTGLSVHRVMAICERYVDLAVAQRDLSEVRKLAIDETSRARGHDYLTRRAEQKRNPDLKGMRWKLLLDPGDLKAEAKAELNGLLAQLTSLRTARAWLYREQLREILQRKQVHVVRRMLTQWCTNVMRSKVEPMKTVARMIRNHLDGIAAWVKSRQTNGFLEALNGLFQAAKRKTRGYTRLSTARTVIFLLAGKLDFRTVNAHAHA